MKTPDKLVLLSDNLQKLKTELVLVSSAVDKIKKASDFQVFEDLIRDIVNSLSGEQYFLAEIAVISVMRKIQEEPTLIPLLQFPFPDKLDTTEHTEFHEFTLINLMSKVTKFMPTVLKELVTLTGKKVLPQIQNLETLIYSNTGYAKEQYNNETTIDSHSESHTELEVHSEASKVSEVESSVQDEKNEITSGYVMETYLVNLNDATDRYFLY